MTKIKNPLLDMTNAVGRTEHDIERPNDSFLKTALPGFKQTLTTRRAIREYDGNRIPEEVMADCLNDAILAPSSSNLQTYELYWIRDIEKRQTIAKACLAQPAAMTAGELIVVVARGDLWEINLKKLLDLMTQKGEKPLPDPVHDYYHRIVPMMLKNDKFGINNLIRRCLFWYKGRKAAITRTPINRGDHRVYAHIQSSLAAQTLMLSLTAHGYDSCPIGGMDNLRIHKILELPSQAEITMVIAAGTGKPEGLYGQRIRLPQSDLIKKI